MSRAIASRKRRARTPALPRTRRRASAPRAPSVPPQEPARAIDRLGGTREAEERLRSAVWTFVSSHNDLDGDPGISDQRKRISITLASLKCDIETLEKASAGAAITGTRIVRELEYEIGAYCRVREQLQEQADHIDRKNERISARADEARTGSRGPAPRVYAHRSELARLCLELMRNDGGDRYSNADCARLIESAPDWDPPVFPRHLLRQSRRGIESMLVRLIAKHRQNAPEKL